MRGLAWRTVCTVRVGFFFLRGVAAAAAPNGRHGAIAKQSESEMQALRQRIADLDATLPRLNARCVLTCGFLDGATLNFSQLAVAESDIAAARDGTQQAVAQLRWGGTGDGSSAMARWTELIWSTQTVAPDDGSWRRGPGRQRRGKWTASTRNPTPTAPSWARSLRRFCSLSMHAYA